MSVTVKLPTQLRDLASGEAEIPVEGATVNDCLAALFGAHPALKDRLTDENGVRRFVNLYVGGEDVRFLDGVNTAVADGAEITVLPAVAGG
ncbi:MAG: MoaD/ThiS family protein [Solirubrobacterales bacterium]|nr:MoaD/ThiS family protein [Solirubrobacterales bacterium]